MTTIEEIRRLLDAARDRLLTAEQLEKLHLAYAAQDAAIARLMEKNQSFRDAAELYRLKATFLQGQLVALREKCASLNETAIADAPGEYRPSSVARRLLAWLVKYERIEFWSHDLDAEKLEWDAVESKAALEELLDNGVVEELSYMPLEGTRYGCTKFGKTLLVHCRRATLSRPSEA